MKTIFIVDDEQPIRELIKKYLIKEGFAAEDFGQVTEVKARLPLKWPDMFILDILMPGMGGLEFCQELRRQRDVPVIFVSAKGDEVDKIIGLELGADDYLAKPFSPRELVARVKTIFRRAAGQGAKSPGISFKDVHFMTDQRAVSVGEKELELTPKEYELLLLLAQNPARAFSREQLVDRIWGIDYVGDTRAVDDLIKRLRKKLKGKSSQVEIVTVWGFGYKINA